MAALAPTSALATTTFDFSESRYSMTGVNGYTNDTVTSSDGLYIMEFYWLQTSGHHHVSSGIEYNHNNSGSNNCSQMQGVYIYRVDGASFDVATIDLYGEATIGEMTSYSNGTGNFTLLTEYGGSSSSPSTVTIGAYGVTNYTIADPGCMGGTSGFSLDNVVLGSSDSDGDGYDASTDCDDNDSSIYPGADEYCDGVDTDCDNTLDEDDALDASTWYADTDYDTYGDSATTNVTCYIASGWVADSSDCNDSDSSIYPGADEYCDGVDTDCDNTLDEDDALDASLWYRDSDSDGYGSSTVYDTECYQPTGYVSDSSDCDDAASATYPGADEYCDGIDTDCDNTVDEDDALDALTWYADTDSDGYGDPNTTNVTCYVAAGWRQDSSDCDDNSSSTYPGADEYCDGIDTDCDTELDEDDALDVLTWYADTDNDGNGDAASTDIDCYEPTGYVADDSDCNDSEQSLNTNDFDGDYFSTCEGDCNDMDATVNADATEIWYDGVDQDCDGWSDYDSDGDGFDSANDADLDGNYGDDCDDEDFDINIDAEEMWYDGVDQNCDEWSDYDADGDGFDSESYGGEDCDDADLDVYPDAPDEPYDGVITDCNNASDYDADSDGYDSVDYGGDDCDDANSEVNVDMEEIWYDGVDQDCDENDDDQDEDGFTVDEDCDDEDAESYPGNGVLDEDCEEILYDTGDTGGDGEKGCEGCSGSRSPVSAAWLLGLCALVLRRRNSSEAGH